MIETENQIDRIKIVMCLSSKVVEQDENCEECPDNGRCLIINPELASIVEKCKKSEQVYEFTPEDSSFIRGNYPKALEYDNKDFNPGITAMKDYMVDTYYNTDIMPDILTEEIVKKLEKNQYSDEEIEALYQWATKILDAKLGF